jgi:hypothetical protein
MKNLAANPFEGADLYRSDVCFNSLTPPARNACEAFAFVEVFLSAYDGASTSGAVSKNPLVSLRSNVHQNVHQRIETDRVGYVRISLDLCCKCLALSHVYSDSDPRLQSSSTSGNTVYRATRDGEEGAKRRYAHEIAHQKVCLRVGNNV